MSQQIPLLDGKYHIIRTIGQGGFGRTFLAEDTSQPNLPRCVIKQFFPSSLGTNKSRDQAAALFGQEAQRLKELGNHSQIPKLLEYFEDAGNQYIAQDFVNGQNLEEELAHSGAFTEPEIRSLLNNLLPVLQFVHEHQVIHRDIKPANIIRRRDRQLVLVDFGVAKYASETVLAKTGTMIGSAEYVAPEQAMGKAVFQSDLYSLGVTCIHLLTQMPPFDLMDHSEGSWIWRDFLLQPVSDRLGDILDKLLARGTKRRYQSAAEVLRDLSAPSLMQVSAASSTSVSETKQNIWRLPLVKTIVAGAGLALIVTVLHLGIGIVPFFEPNITPPTVRAPQPPLPPGSIIEPGSNSRNSDLQATESDQLPQNIILFVIGVIRIVGGLSVMVSGAILAYNIKRDEIIGSEVRLLGTGILLIIITSIILSSVESTVEQATTPVPQINQSSKVDIFLP